MGGMDSKKIVLIGGGGHCRSVIDSLKQLNEYIDIVITDPSEPIGREIMGCKVVGNDDALPRLFEEGYTNAFITVGNVNSTDIRQKIRDKVVNFGFEFPVIIDPSAKISKSALIGCGTFVGKNVVVNTDTEVGSHCIINTGAIIEHECMVDDFTHISVGSILCGEVNVGRNSFIGAGSTIIQCLSIGENVVIGANSTVLTNVESNMSCYGIVKKNRGGIA